MPDVLDGGTAVVKVVANGAALSSSITSGVTKSTASLGSSLAGVGKLLGVTLGAAFVVGFAKSSLAAVEEANKVDALLQHAFAPLGEVGAKMFQPVLDWAGKLQFSIGQDDEAIKTMAARLATMGQEFFKAAGPDAAQALETLTLGLTDMAAATGKSASMLMRSLGPAILNTPEKAVALLEKLGTVTDAQAERVKKLTAAGQKEAATQLIINTLSEKYAGAAAAAATPSEKLAVAMGEVKESVGTLLLPLVRVIAGFAKWASENIALIGVIAGSAGLIFTVSKLRDALLALQATKLGAWATSAAAGLGPLGTFLATLTNPATLAGLATLGVFLAVNTVNQNDYNAAIRNGVDALIAFGPASEQYREALDPGGEAWATFAKDHQEMIDKVNALAQAEVGYIATTQDGSKIARLGWHDTTASVVADVKIQGGAIDKLVAHMGDQQKASRQWAQSTIGSFDLIGGGLENVTAKFATTTGGIIKASRIIADKQQTIANELGKLDKVKIGEGLRQQIENLGPDIVHEFLALGPKGRKAFEDNMKTYIAAQKETNQKIKAEAKAGFEAVAEASADGFIQGILRRSPDISAAAVKAVRAAIDAAKLAAGIKSPSAVFRGIGEDMVRGLVLGLSDSRGRTQTEAVGHVVVENMLRGMQGRFSVIQDQLRTLIPFISKALGAGATDQAKAFLRDLDELDKRFGRLRQKVGDFRSAIRGAFGTFGDLMGGIGSQLEQFRQDQAQFTTDQANFLQAQAEGQTGLIAPIAPQAPDLHAFIAAQIQQATQLSALLKQLQKAGLSTPLLGQLAGLDATSAIAEAQVLLSDPALIAQANAAQQQIADITQSTVDKMTNAAFGDQVIRMSAQFDKLIARLADFIQGINPGALTDKTRDFIHALDHMIDALNRVAGDIPQGGRGVGTPQQPPQQLAPVRSPAAEVHIHIEAGALIHQNDLPTFLRDAMAEVERRNVTSGLKG